MLRLRSHLQPCPASRGRGYQLRTEGVLEIPLLQRFIVGDLRCRVVRQGPRSRGKTCCDESLNKTPFDGFVYLPTTRVLIKFPRFMEMRLGCPQPVPPFKVADISRPELLELLATEKKKEQEDLLLSPLLID